MMVTRRLTFLALGFACIGFAAVGEAADQARSSEIRALMIRTVQIEANTVQLVLSDGARLTLPAADLKIIDERIGVRTSRKMAASGTSAKIDRAHDLPVAALSDLANQAAVPAVAKIKYEKDGTIKKVKLRIFDSSGLAAQAKQEMEQKELRRETRRPANR